MGALEDYRPIGSLSVADLKSSIAAHGGDPDFQGNLSSELQELVRLATGLLSPLAVQPTQINQPRRLRSTERAEAAAAAFHGNIIFAPLVLGPAPGQVLSPAAASPTQPPTFSRVAPPVVSPVPPPVAPPPSPQSQLTSVT